MAFEFTDQNFQDTALKDGTLAVIDFWAEWCGPCRMVSPIIDELSQEFTNGSVVIGKVNVDHNPEISMKYGIRSIPTILFVKDGEVVDKHVGTTTKQNLESKIKAYM